jgi:hypothetical protein
MSPQGVELGQALGRRVERQPLQQQALAHGDGVRLLGKDPGAAVCRGHIACRDPRHPHELPMRGQLQPPVPVLEQVQRLIEAAAVPFHRMSPHQRRVQRQEVLEAQAVAVEVVREDVVGAPHPGFLAAVGHVRVRRQRLRAVLQRALQPRQVAGQEDVVVVEEDHAVAACGFDAGVGGC